MSPESGITLTGIRGIRVGHAARPDALTGCTVVLCPPGTRAALEIRGGAPGSRETELLRPGRLVESIDAVVLAGGSAWGLEAAGGVMRFLEEQGRGFRAPHGPVPIVPCAILYDLAIGDPSVRPDAAMGYEAASKASSAPVESGAVGAGTGCTVGKAFGMERASRGGLGNAGLRLPGGAVVAALVAVNALGDIVDDGGRIIAGARACGAEQRFADSAASLLSGRESAPRTFLLESTVIGVVATDAKLGRDALLAVARAAHDGIARAVRPAHTIFDGDTVFALATGEKEGDPFLVSIAAAEVMAQAVRAAPPRDSGPKSENPQSPGLQPEARLSDRD